MSAALPYLRALRKSDLVSLAELSDMKECVYLGRRRMEGAGVYPVKPF